MKFCITALLLLFIANVSAQSSSWTYCPGTGAGHLTVSNVTLNPDPPVRGKDDHVTLTGSLDETVTGGAISLTITYLGFPVFSQTYKICDTVTCPYTQKNITSSITVPGSAVPSISPAGSYVGVATLTDQNGASLACVQVSFTLPPSWKSKDVEMSPQAAAKLMAQFNGL